MANHYDLLGVPVDASQDDIRAAFRKAAVGCHPDTHPGDLKAEQRYRTLSQAYQTLTDPAAKAKYDLVTLPHRPPLVNTILDGLSQAADIAHGIFGFFSEHKPTQKRASCASCKGSGKLSVDLGPIQVLKSCPDCEP